jgi:hypothetical protein
LEIDRTPTFFFLIFQLSTPELVLSSEHMKKTASSSLKSQKAREELLQFLTQKKEQEKTDRNYDRRKHVRILHNHHLSNADNILEELNSTDSSYIDRITSLKSYQSITKQAEKEKVYQLEWFDERHRLDSTLHRLEHSVNDTFQSLLLGDVALSSEINDVLSLQEHQSQERRQFKAGYDQQLKEVKRLIEEFHLSQVGEERTMNKKRRDEVENEKEDKSVLVTSIIADLLMKLRLDFQRKWNSFEEEEKKLDKEIHSIYNTFQRILHNDFIKNQNNEILNNLKNIFNEIDVKDLIEWNQSVTYEAFVEDYNPIVPLLDLPNNDGLKGGRSPKKQKESPINPDTLVDTFVLINSPRTKETGRNSNLKESFPLTSPRKTNNEPFSPNKNENALETDANDKIRDTLKNLLMENVSSNNTNSGKSKEEIKKFQFLFTDLEISPILYQYLYQIYLLDQDYTSRLKEKYYEKQIFCNDVGIIMPSKTMDDGDDFDGNTPRSSRKQEEETINQERKDEQGFYGNFPDKISHDIFIKIYRKAELTGMLRKKMLELLKTELLSSYPSLIMDDILLHEEWYRKMKMINNKYKQYEIQYKTQRKEIIQQMKTTIKQLLIEKKEKFIADQQLMELNSKRSILYEQLSLMKEERQKKESLQYNEYMRKQQELKEMNHQKELLLQQEREYKKSLLLNYYNEKRQLEEQQRRRLEEQKQQEMERTKLLIEENKPKILFRQQKVEEKRQKQKLLEEQAQEDEQRRLELLNKLAEQAPYWSSIQNIESRFDHATTSSTAQSYIPRDENDELTRGHLPLNGFTDHRVIRDTRFRLVEALRMANLMNTQAAAEVIQRYHPRPHLAIHGII